MKVIFVRPAVQSHEDLGYLPGDLNEKTAPYMTPFQISATKILNGRFQGVKADFQTMTLAFLRGITFDNA